VKIAFQLEDGAMGVSDLQTQYTLGHFGDGHATVYQLVITMCTEILCFFKVQKKQLLLIRKYHFNVSKF